MTAPVCASTRWMKVSPAAVDHSMYRSPTPLNAMPLKALLAAFGTVVRRTFWRVGVEDGCVVGRGPWMTPRAAAVPVLLTTNRFPAASNAMSPLVAFVPLGTVWGTVELATTPMGVPVVVFHPKTVITLLGPLASHAQ